MQTYSTVFERILDELLQRRIAHFSDILTNGAAVPTFNEYKQYTGMIAGLKEAQELMQEARELADKN
jgi:hypothetical protein